MRFVLTESPSIPIIISWKNKNSLNLGGHIPRFYFSLKQKSVSIHLFSVFRLKAIYKIDAFLPKKVDLINQIPA